MIRLGIGEGEKLTRHLAAKVKLAKERGTVSAGLRLVQIITTRLIPAEDPPPIDQRAYVAGWDTQPTDYGAIVFNTAPHAVIIEHGGRAGFEIGRKMIDALAEWVVRKGLLGKGSGSIQGRSQEQEAQSFAWAIATKMRQRGIFNRNGGEGLRIAEKAAALAPGVMVEEIRAELEEALKGD